MQERIDIINIRGEKTGESATYDEVHKRGLMHRTVHIWLINDKEQLLLQKRVQNKRAYPLHWDISAAGHISAGESSLEAAQKEVREEIGLDIPSDQFRFLFTIKQERLIHGDDFIDDEINDIYLVKYNGHTSDFKLGSDEVESVKWIDIPQFKAWIKGTGEKIVPHEEEYRHLLKEIAS